MPAKGTRKRKPVPKKKRKTLGTTEDVWEELERLAVIHGLINPRNGEGNRCAVLRLAIHTLKVWGRYYHNDSMPQPHALVSYLHRRVEAGDEEAQEHLDYLESWSSLQNFKDSVTEGIIEVKDSYIV